MKAWTFSDFKNLENDEAAQFDEHRGNSTRRDCVLHKIAHIRSGFDVQRDM